MATVEAALFADLDLLMTRSCQICGWTALDGLDLCVGCLDIREWSQLNRAFCDLIHRDQPVPSDTEPETQPGVIPVAVK